MIGSINTKYFISSCFFVLVCCFATQAQSMETTPKKVLILGGIAHIGNGDVMHNVAIALENGYIRFVRYQMAARINRADYDTVIQLENEHIYPAFIAPNTTLGLREIDAVRATLDYSDVGEYNPNVRSIIAYNAESRITPTIRSNGVLLAQITPRGGVISGSSSIVELDAWNWEDATHTEDEGIHLNWPKQFNQSGWWAEPGGLKPNPKQDERIASIYTFFDQAQAYALASDSNLAKSKRNKQAESIQLPYNLRFEAMKGLFNGTKTLYIHANRAQEIVEAVQLKRKYTMPKMVIVGGYDAWLVPDVLKDDNVPVILRKVHELPLRTDDPIDLPYRLPAILDSLGVLFCLDMGSGDMEVMNQRNLPFLAGTAVAYGLAPEKGISSITYNTSKILGIDSRVGTLSPGMEATFFISKGDALDMRSNDVIYAFVKGRIIDLNNVHKELYMRYKERLENTSK
jgi:imidazolonepropionase-like amidohydrolase